MFVHSPEIRRRFPALRHRLLLVQGVDRMDPAALDPAPFVAEGMALLIETPESALPPIRAWREAFAAMGLKPTQVRSASEALLRRLRLQGDLPRLHPLVDFGNAVSAAHAIPLAIFDLDRLRGTLTVRPAKGTETYDRFDGGQEYPDPGEVIFADDAGIAHARRWVHRQSARSAVGHDTRRALMVAEALHTGAAADLARMIAALSEGLRAAGGTVTTDAA